MAHFFNSTHTLTLDPFQRLLQKLNLPGALDALDKHAGIPPSLLRRSEEIRSMGGVEALQSLVDEVQTLGASAGSILEEVPHLTQVACASVR
jgi:programmed cell death 6-interacting protein